jgi:hypothetical protein
MDQKFVANFVDRMPAQRGETLAKNGKNYKTLDFPRWLQLSKNKYLTKLPVV